MRQQTLREAQSIVQIQKENIPMTCPRCQSELRQQNKDGIEIDVCSQCRGIWLDRGELDRLSTAENNYYRRDDDDDDDYDDDSFGGRNDRDTNQPGGRQPKKKRGFFQNLMDNVGELGGG